MKKLLTPAELRRENAELRARLAEAEETLNAIRSGDVDAMVMGGQVYTLQGAETPYRVLVEAMNEGAATLSLSGSIRYGNSRLAQLVGEPLENLIGTSLRRFIEPAERRAFDRLLVSGKRGSSRGEFIFHCPNGAVVPVQLSVSALDGPKARDVGVVATDLTERKQAGEKLRESEERFRQMAENVQEVFWLVDAKKGQILYVSPAYETIWGRSCEQLHRNPCTWAAAIHAEDLERVVKANDNLAKADGSMRVEFRIIRPDGSVRWIANHGVTVRDKAGQVYRIAGVARDISEQKKLQAEVERVSEMERQRLGHDLHDGLCQYLTAMSMLSDLLQKSLTRRGLPEAAQARKLAQHAQDAKLITHDLSRVLYPGSLQISGLPTALTELALLVQRMYPIRCRASADHVQRFPDLNLERQLFRIAQEAAFNAAKHSGGRNLWITLGRSKHWLTLTIKDDGTGILKEKMSADGMGLNIMKYRADLIGATMTTVSRTGRGTTVTCKLKKSSANEPFAG